MTDLLMDVRSDIEQGTSLSGAFGVNILSILTSYFVVWLRLVRLVVYWIRQADKLATYMEKRQPSSVR